MCPSGVGYGRGLEAAREMIAKTRPLSWFARAVLSAFTTPGLSQVVYALGRMFRATGIPRLLAGKGPIGFAMGMLAATKPAGRRVAGKAGRRVGNIPPALPASRPPVLLFRGCIMDGFFSHVHDATIRTLTVNGYDVREVPGQVCCGALHVHAGLAGEAQVLARRNAAVFGDGDEPIVLNSAGCGAAMKEYGHLLDSEAGRKFAARVRDVTELLAERGPRPGAPVDLRVAYDPPCHLLHAQRIVDPPLRLFQAIPVMQLISTPDAAQCCGSAGLFTIVQPEMSRAVLGPKIDSLREAAPQVVATGNPGCLMQLGGGLAAARISARVRHPVELLDESYRAAGYYE